MQAFELPEFPGEHHIITVEQLGILGEPKGHGNDIHRPVRPDISAEGLRGYEVLAETTEETYILRQVFEDGSKGESVTAGNNDPDLRKTIEAQLARRSITLPQIHIPGMQMLPGDMRRIEVETTKKLQNLFGTRPPREWDEGNEMKPHITVEMMMQHPVLQRFIVPREEFTGVNITNIRGKGGRQEVGITPLFEDDPESTHASLTGSRQHWSTQDSADHDVIVAVTQLLADQGISLDSLG